MTKSVSKDNGLALPLIGAQVFIEPGQTPEEIDTWFRILQENNLPICRVRLFEAYMRKPDGEWDFSLVEPFGFDRPLENFDPLAKRQS